MHKVQTSLRLDEDKFREAKEILGQLGMNFTEAVNIFTSMIIAKQGLPFEVVLPNEETIKAMRDIRAKRKSKEITLDELKSEMGIVEKTP